MTMIGKVRRMFHRQNKSVREIARLTSLSRNTISKYLNMDVQEEPKYQRRSQPTRLTPFHEVLMQALSVDSRRPKKERRTSSLTCGFFLAGQTGITRPVPTPPPDIARSPGCSTAARIFGRRAAHAAWRLRVALSGHSGTRGRQCLSRLFLLKRRGFRICDGRIATTLLALK